MSGGWMVPQDGGRGREVRRRWWAVRWFSWRYGTAWRRSHRTHVVTTWHLFHGDEVLFGLSTFKDEDGDRNVRLGCWPLHLAVYWTPWARPDALGWRFGSPSRTPESPVSRPLDPKEPPAT